MEWLLLLGLIILGAAYRNQSVRLKRLEAMLDALPIPADGGPWEHAADGAAAGPAPIPPREMAAWLARPAAPLPHSAPADMLGEAPVPEDGDETATEERESFGALFERLVAGRMLIWVAGIAFAVAGVLMVRYSIERGWATPPVRMIMAAIFGFVLLGAGEYARSRPGSRLDPRAGQALAGAGILVLYATPYGAHVLYQLISMGTASALMVIVTAGALILSLRHGPPTAMLGLAGGFATPALVGGDSGAIPLLTYLGLLDIALFTLAQRRGWTWLAAAAVLLSFVWTGALTAAPRPDALAAGLFILALAVAGSLVRPGPGRQLATLRPAGIGLLQLAILVGRSDLGRPAWLLFAALSLAAILLGGRRPEFRRLPAFALILALLLLALKAWGWEDPNTPLAGIGITLLFGAAALERTLRGADRAHWVAIGSLAFAGPDIILRWLRPELLALPAWGGLAALLALGPLFLAWSRRGAAGREKPDRALVLAAAAAMLLTGLAAYDLLPDDLLPAAWLAIAAACAFAARRLADRGLFLLACLPAGFAVLWAAVVVQSLWRTLVLSLLGEPALVTGLPAPAAALQLLLLPAGLLFLVWHWMDEALVRNRRFLLAAGGIFLGLSAYIMFKQAFGLAGRDDFVARGFAERMVLTQLLFASGWLLGSGRARLLWLDARALGLIGTILTGLAAGRLLWFDLLLHDPAFTPQYVGPLPMLNLLAPAFLLSAAWLYQARRRARNPAVSGAWLGAFLAALIGGTMLIVRQLFQGAILSGPNLPKAEFYGYSLAGLLLAIAIMLAGMRLPDKALRLAGLFLLSATIVKVFAFDAAALEGILRILSFVGLGIGVIGIALLYTKVLNAEMALAGAGRRGPGAERTGQVGRAGS
jgi:uncharacterized membrane protein